MLSYKMSAPTPQQEPDPDWMLIRAMADGDVRALDELYSRYAGQILAFLRTKVSDQRLAEELLQDVMLAAWENASGFEARSKVKTWLLVIARNRAINTYRKKRLPIININDVFSLQTDDTGPVDAAVKKDRESKVREAVHKLPEIQRDVLVLVFYHQLSGPEVAEVLDISEGTVKSRLHRAKEMLRRILSQEDDL